MADQGQWFKLWCSVLDDPDLDALDLEQFARWAKLGALVKRQGTDGVLVIRPPARVVLAMFQVPSFDALLSAFHGLPGVFVRRVESSVSNETESGVSYSVSFVNWMKYQGDFSTPRVRSFRARQAEMKRLRGEEKRGDETRGEVVGAPPPISGGSDQPERRVRPWPKHVAARTLPRKIRIGRQTVAIPGAIRPVVDAWASGYERYFRRRPEPPKPWDLVAAEELVERHGPEFVLAIVEGAMRVGGTHYMRTRDKWGLRDIQDEWNALVSMHLKGDLA